LKLMATNGKRRLWKDASGMGWHIRDIQSANCADCDKRWL
jgi:hypothetical protein